MMGKHKLALVSEEKLRKDARDEILILVQARFSKGKDTSLQDIQDVFQKAPYDLSEGTVINYLEELVVNRKLSTWKVKNRRFYGPPKIPFSIKIGITTSVIIVVASLLIDTLLPRNIIHRYIYFGYLDGNAVVQPQTTSMLPLTVYLLSLTIIFTAIWYFSNRKIYK
jgi:hypothetical protein